MTSFTPMTGAPRQTGEPAPRGGSSRPRRMLRVSHRAIALLLSAGLYGACTDRDGDPGSLCETLAARDCSGAALTDEERAIEIQSCEDSRTTMHEIYGPDCGAKYDAVLECTTKVACDGDVEVTCAAEIAATAGCLPEPGPACEAFGEGLGACGEAVDADDLQVCQVVLNESKFGDPECGEAIEAHYFCLGERSCAEHQADSGCESTEAAIDAVCEPYEDGPPARPIPPSSAIFTR